MSNEVNPYEAPQSRVAESVTTEQVLASRWERLGAAIVDTILALAMVLPFMVVAFSNGDDSQWLEQYNWLFEENLPGIVVTTLYTFGAFLLLHGVLLARNGQTIGKKIVGIKVVDYQTGKLLSFNKIVGLRYFPLWVVQSIPLVGGLLSLINVLAIFGAEKRCVHDLIAGTKVVNV
ncbi:MAG: RDD family protein [Kangiellaceae bacterium]|nr:RDD family protein [Kangiellaceae bacterium]MCW8997703.1 RDD family protein [Kangiellaceae bacterium]